MSSTGAGSNIVAIRNVKSAFLPRNRSRANGKAIRDEEITTPTTFITTRKALLAEYRMNFSLTRASWNVCQCQYFVGNHSGGKVKTGAVSGLSAAASIQPTGNRMNRLARISTVYTNTACRSRGRRGKRERRGERVRAIGLCAARCAIVLLLRLVEDEASL